MRFNFEMDDGQVFLDGPGFLATRPSHVLQTAFRCAKKFLKIISVKISEEVFIFS